MAKGNEPKSLRFYERRSSDMRVRILSLLRPFCHLLIRAVRVDSPPCNSNSETLSNLILFCKHYRLVDWFSLNAIQKSTAETAVMNGLYKQWDC
jgi:hypothetical protein